MSGFKKTIEKAMSRLKPRLRYGLAVALLMAPLVQANPDAAAPTATSADPAANTRARPLSVAELAHQLGMEVSAPELAAIESAIQSAVAISRKAETINGRPFRRDAHAKATGCLRAVFSINADIPEQFRYSVFRQPGREYRAWVRFSNGDMLVQPDRKRDARGMAIKLMGVEGERIAPELKGAPTQDFIMTNTAAFFNRNIYDYAENATYLTRLDRTGWFFGLLPPRFHPKAFYRAVQTISSEIETPLDAQYYSILPYQLGHTSLKFSARPCPGSDYPAADDKSNPDYLTEQMADHLDKGAACFEFMLQPRIPGADMPMDDALVIWSEQESPFIPVARLHIPPQTFTAEAQQLFCENLSMNPWHGVGQWRPQGSLNRARRLVYNAVSRYRHQQNQARRQEPDSWCVPGADQPCTPDQGLHISKSRWPLPRCFDELYRPLADVEIDGSERVASECPQQTP